MRDTPSGLQPVEASAGALFADALEHCSRRTGERPEAVLERLCDCDPETHGAFRYALAKGLGEYLGGLGVAFRAVYVYGSAMGETSSPCSDIDIILDLDHDTDRVDRLMRGLDVALVTQFRAFFPWAKGLTTLLDVRTVASGSKNARNSYSGGFSGLGASPVCLWRFPPGNTVASAKRPPGEPHPLARVDEELLHLERIVDVELDQAQHVDVALAPRIDADRLAKEGAVIAEDH